MIERKDFNSESAFLKALEHEAWEEYLDEQNVIADAPYDARYTAEGIGYAMTEQEPTSIGCRLAFQGCYELKTKPPSSGWTQEQLESWLEYYRQPGLK